MENTDQDIIYSPEQLRKKLIRRVEESKTDSSSTILEKAKNSFNLSKNKFLADSVQGDVKLLCYSSDPLTTPSPELLELSRHEIQPNLLNSRIRIHELPVARPNDEGNYIYTVNTREFGQINAFYHSLKTLRMIEEYLLHELTWGFNTQFLNIEPHAGVDANAYYSESEQTLAFFSFLSGQTEILTSHSPEVVAHETGHACLDSVEFRDIHNECFGAACGGGHESFGDVCSILRNLHTETVISKLLEITNGNLHQDNLVASLAEQLGAGLHHIDQDPTNDNVFYLRNAINDFVSKPYENLEFLPDDPLTTLGLESHNYSRLLTGAFWDYLVNVYESKVNELGKPGALQYARDLVGRVWLRGIELGPIGEYHYDDLAKSIMDASRIYFPAVDHNILVDVFDKRKICDRQTSLSYLNSRNNLPQITLPNNLLTLEDMTNFLSDIKPSLNIGGDVNLIPQSGYTNNMHFTFLNYAEVKRIILDGEEFSIFNGSPLDIFGGISLLFGNDNRLINSNIRLVTADDVNHVKTQIAKMIEAGIIETESNLSLNNLIKKGIKSKMINKKGRAISIPIAVQGIASRNSSGKIQLIKNPIRVDVINFTGTGIKEYINEWNEKLNKQSR